MQLELFDSIDFPVGAWATQAQNKRDLILFLPDPTEALKLGLGKALRENGVRLRQPRGVAAIAGGYAYCLECPEPISTLILTRLPRPLSAGSNTITNFLPW